MLSDLENLSHVYALATLDRLGWQRDRRRTRWTPKTCGNGCRVGDEHRAPLPPATGDAGEDRRAGTEADGGFVVAVEIRRVRCRTGHAGRRGSVRGPAICWRNTTHGSNEIGLFRRSANALPDVLRGEADALTLLFSSGEPTAADLYLKAPVARAANRLLADAIDGTPGQDLPGGAPAQGDRGRCRAPGRRPPRSCPSFPTAVTTTSTRTYAPFGSN